MRRRASAGATAFHAGAMTQLQRFPRFSHGQRDAMAEAMPEHSESGR